MTRTLLAVVIISLSLTGALARHLLHSIPLDVGREIEEKCQKEAPSSAFAQGSCIDKDAVEWLRTHPGQERTPPPDEPVQGTITLPGLLDQPGSASVKQFAEMMIKDHNASSAGLKAAAQQDGVAVPRQMVSKDVKNIDRLEKVSGGAFDNGYISEQRVAHQQALALLTAYAKDGSAAALKAHAAKTAPVVEVHLDHLKTLR